MKKSIEKLVKSITESTSITDICDNQICNTLSPVIDFSSFQNIVFLMRLRIPAK
ncbi:hypothetical protein Bmyc01_58890 [Bacillus mycoides]|nr:hypothetical protein Bmyc01_58890 [Bacillus mycoides]